MEYLLEYVLRILIFQILMLTHGQTNAYTLAEYMLFTSYFKGKPR